MAVVETGGSARVADSVMEMMFLFQHKLMRPSELITRNSLSQHQFFALINIARRGPLPARDLSLDLMISKQQMTPILDRLESLNLISRMPASDDRRLVELSATEKGLALLNETKKAFHEMLEQRFRIFSEPDVSRLLFALGEIQEIFGKLPD